MTNKCRYDEESFNQNHTKLLPDCLTREILEPCFAGQGWEKKY